MNEIHVRIMYNGSDEKIYALTRANEPAKDIAKVHIYRDFPETLMLEPIYSVKLYKDDLEGILRVFEWMKWHD